MTGVPTVGRDLSVSAWSILSTIVKLSSLLDVVLDIIEPFQLIASAVWGTG